MQQNHSHRRMKKDHLFRTLQPIVAAVLTVVIFSLSGCTNGQVVDATSKITDTAGLTPCSDPRPQLCTADYRPVCAELKDGASKTYSNACSSCIDLDVIGYRDGDCEAVK